MEEVRKDIPGIQGYQASSLGKIRSIDRVGVYKRKFGIVNRPIKGKLLIPILNCGYYYVSIWLNNKQKCYSIHRLVMLTFVGSRPLGYQINHKDGIKGNNSAHNLEYCTGSENMRHAVKIGLRLTPKGKNNKLSKKIHIEGNGISTIVHSAREASEITGVDRSTISKKCRKKLKRPIYKNNNGYAFTYI